MRGVRGAASIIALAAWVTSAIATPYHLPGKGEDFRPPPPASLPGDYDPYQRPATNRSPDAYVDGRPYWFGSQVTRTPWVQTRAEVRPPPPASLPGDYDPYQRPATNRSPDAYVDGRPYWFGSRVGGTPWVQTPAGYVVQPLWSAELGARYFGSSGSKQFDLQAFPPGGFNLPISRLTWRDLVAHSGEVFGRAEHGTGLFVKGYVGGGVIPSGTLQDEDFPPFIDPYSSTNSQQRNGSLFYGAVDFGWAWRASAGSKVGFFAGYFHYFDHVNAFGCVQTATSSICVPPLPPSDLGISQDTHWNAVRLGISTEWKLTDGLKFSAEVAWLPAVWLNGTDTHFHTFGTTGHGGNEALSSFQLEAMLSYYFANGFSVGIGGRYWILRSAPDNVEVDFRPVGGGIQGAGITMERWGAFLQTSYQFGNQF